MFETIQNAYSRVQKSDPAPNNVIQLKPVPMPVEKTGATEAQDQTRSTEKVQNQGQLQGQGQQQGAGNQDAKTAPVISQKLLDELQVDIKAMHNIGLQFSVHEETGKTMIKVMDETNSSIIREIPPKAVLDLAAKLDEMLGILFDKKV